MKTPAARSRPDTRSYREALERASTSGLIWAPLLSSLEAVTGDARRAQIAELLASYQKAPYAKKAIRARLERLAGWKGSYAPAKEVIDRLDLVDLYCVRKSLLDPPFAGTRGRLRAIADSIRLKGQVVATVTQIGRRIRKTTSIQEATDVHGEIAGRGLERFTARHGLDIQIDYGACSLAELNSRPHVYYFTHQGGGLETLMVASLFRAEGRSGRPNSILLKSELRSLPMMGDILNRLGSIYVERSKLLDPGSRERELSAIAVQMQRSIADGRGLLLYPEGTRSADGNVAGSPARIKWAQDLKAAVDQALIREPAPQVLVLVDTLLAFPSTVEKPANWLDDQVRKNAGLKIRFFRLPDDLKFEDQPGDPYDPGNFFGFARRNLAAIQRAELAKLLG